MSRAPRNNHATKKRPKRSKRRTAIIVIACSFCFLILIGAGFFMYFLSRINYTPLGEFELSETIPPDEVDPSADPSYVEELDPEAMRYAAGNILFDNDIQNILLIGSDSRGGSGYGRSDTMMLLSIDKKSNRLIMTSFLRDMYVKIEGVKDNRINVSYGYGGPKLLIETIENNFRIRIDNYVRVDFESFVDVIDAIGGINIDMTSKEARELNNNPGRYAGGGTLKKVNEGTNNLDGATALAYARIRHIDSDFGRTQRQRTVMVAMVTKLKSSSVSTILGIADEFLPQIQTDLTSSEITGLIWDSGALMNYPIEQCTIPAKGTYSNKKIRGMAVLLPDIEENKKVLWALLYNK